MMPEPQRSNRADVRNQLMQLPAAVELRRLPIEARRALYLLLTEIAEDARTRAEQCWRKHKAPMAAYWKAVAVYANHTRRLLR